MYIVQVLINFIISSGSGQALVTMPIMAPLADMLGITRQTAVLAFQLGDGFTCILPHKRLFHGCISYWWRVLYQVDQVFLSTIYYMGTYFYCYIGNCAINWLVLNMLILVIRISELLIKF